MQRAMRSLSSLPIPGQAVPGADGPAAVQAGLGPVEGAEPALGQREGERRVGEVVRLDGALRMTAK